MEEKEKFDVFDFFMEYGWVFIIVLFLGLGIVCAHNIKVDYDNKVQETEERIAVMNDFDKQMADYQTNFTRDILLALRESRNEVWNIRRDMADNFLIRNNISYVETTALLGCTQVDSTNIVAVNDKAITASFTNGYLYFFANKTVSCFAMNETKIDCNTFCEEEREFFPLK